MQTVEVNGNWDDWVQLARAALRDGRGPSELEWRDMRANESTVSQEGLALNLGLSSSSAAGAVAESTTGLAPPGVFKVPRRFLEMGRYVGFHRDPQRWDLIYRVLWRLTHGEAHVLEIPFDADVDALRKREKSVHHDVHKMRAFVRFREVNEENGVWFVAWYQPDHYTLSLNADFFRDRFAQMRWSILTPDECLHWDGAGLRFTPGVPQSLAPTEDQAEGLWRTYYRHTFNPARLKVKTMTQHMPRRFWQNMPETRDLVAMIAESAPLVETMLAKAENKIPPAQFVPADIPRTGDLDTLRRAAQACRACPLWKDASCAVFGEGPSRASVLIVGEQPGDQEDRAGHPFVGPAGQLLNRAFAAAGIARSELYVTNAVKHFKWTPRGKRRLHAKPNARETAACRPWLAAEIDSVKPDLIVCLGATAALSVTGTDLRVTEMRGQTVATEFGTPALITLHPSALLRLPEGADPEREFRLFVADLRKILEFAPSSKAVDPLA